MTYVIGVKSNDLRTPMAPFKLRHRLFHVLVPVSLIGLTLLFVHTSKTRFTVKTDNTNHALTAKLIEQNTRQYEIKSPTSIAGWAVEMRIKGMSLSPVQAGFTSEFQEFVNLGEDGSLQLQNQSYFLNGFNNYYMHSRSAWIPEGRAQVDNVFAFAKELRMNALRTWAFADGDEWNALQPLPGIIDKHMFKEGLDYVVYKARLHGIRLVLTLTNYNPHFGGMAQYLKWNNRTNITEFYTNSKIKQMYKDYVFAVLHRINSYDKVMYKDNPTILGWELANEPRDPGSPGSHSLQSWIEEMSCFIKSLDTHHLVMVGLDGYYGPSTPHLLPSNPKNLFYSAVDSNIPLLQHDAICEGCDFWQNHKPQHIDISTTHLYPDSWLSCDEECALEWSRKWIRDHAKLAKKLKKPLLIGEFGKLKPISVRNRFLNIVHEALYEAIAEGLPIAGSLFWMLGDEEYADYDGFTVFPKDQAFKKTRQQTPTPVETDKLLEMFNYQSLLQCLINQAEASVSEQGETWNQGWNSTNEIFQRHSEVLQDFKYHDLSI